MSVRLQRYSGSGTSPIQVRFPKTPELLSGPAVSAGLVGPVDATVAAVLSPAGADGAWVAVLSRSVASDMTWSGLRVWFVTAQPALYGGGCHDWGWISLDCARAGNRPTSYCPREPALNRTMDPLNP